MHTDCNSDEGAIGLIVASINPGKRGVSKIF